MITHVIHIILFIRLSIIKYHSWIDQSLTILTCTIIVFSNDQLWTRFCHQFCLLMRGVHYSACGLCYKKIAQFHQKCSLMRDCSLFRRLLLPDYTVHYIAKVSVKATIRILYIRTVMLEVYFSFGKFNSLLVGMGRK